MLSVCNVERLFKNGVRMEMCRKRGHLPSLAELHRASQTQGSPFVPAGLGEGQQVNPEVITPNLNVDFQHSKLEVT